MVAEHNGQEAISAHLLRNNSGGNRFNSQHLCKSDKRVEIGEQTESSEHYGRESKMIGNPGPGGWATVLMSGGKSWEISGSRAWTTISEMELVAAVEALQSIPAGSKVRLCSDSKLLIYGMLFHVMRWQSHG